MFVEFWTAQGNTSFNMKWSQKVENQIQKHIKTYKKTHGMHVFPDPSRTFARMSDQTRALRSPEDFFLKRPWAARSKEVLGNGKKLCIKKLCSTQLLEKSIKCI